MNTKRLQEKREPVKRQERKGFEVRFETRKEYRILLLKVFGAGIGAGIGIFVIFLRILVMLA